MLPRNICPASGARWDNTVDVATKAYLQSRNFRLVAQAFVPVQMSVQTRMSVPRDALEPCHILLIVPCRLRYRQRALLGGSDARYEPRRRIVRSKTV